MICLLFLPIANCYNFIVDFIILYVFLKSPAPGMKGLDENKFLRMAEKLESETLSTQWNFKSKGKNKLQI